MKLRKFVRIWEHLRKSFRLFKWCHQIYDSSIWYWSNQCILFVLFVWDDSQRSNDFKSSQYFWALLSITDYFSLSLVIHLFILLVSLLSLLLCGQHLLFCVLSIFPLTLLVLRVLFYTAINCNFISLMRFPLRGHIQVKSCAIFGVSRLKYPYGCFFLRDLFCNGYRRWKWTQWPKFKTWTRQFASHAVLIS